MKTLAAIAVVLLVTGCAQYPSKELQEDIRTAHQRATNAEPLRVFTCLSEKECEKAFRATKSYITENSRMRIQVVDSSFVSTYRPPQVNTVGMEAVRSPVEREIEQIKLTVECRSPRFGDNGYCDNMRGSIYEGFIPYLESRIK